MIKQIKNKIDTATFTDINSALKSVTFYTWIYAAVMFSCYLYFVGALTFSVIKENSLKEQIKTIVSSMSQQELAYLSKQKQLTEEYALKNGFVPASAISFASSQKSFAWNVGQ